MNFAEYFIPVVACHTLVDFLVYETLTMFKMFLKTFKILAHGKF